MEGTCISSGGLEGACWMEPGLLGCGMELRDDEEDVVEVVVVAEIPI